MAKTVVMNVTFDDVARDTLALEENVKHTIPLTEMRVWDDFASLLPNAAAVDDLGLVDGTFGTGSPSLQSSDFGGTTAVQYARFNFVIPSNWISTLKVQLHAGMLTTVADTKAEFDVECYKSDREAGIGSDLVTTAATSFNSTTLASNSFTINTSGLSVGDLLDIRLKFDGSDTGDLGVMKGIIGEVAMIMDVRG